jgi:pSer/pThr/pTyr-binding forkhead associated (FHA) protein
MSGPILLALRLLLTVAMYGFLGWAFWVLWQDLRRHSRSLAAAQVPALTLVLQIDGEESSFRFDRSEILVGRDIACDCHLDDRTVSAQHARLAYHHRQWWVEDLSSRNGTFLNQESVAGPLVLASGDQLRFGQVTLQVLLSEAPAGVS